MFELNESIPLKVAVILFIFISAIALLGWAIDFLNVSRLSNLFSIASPIGVIAILLMLVLGGFYLFKTGIEVTKGLMK
ncbi:MAG: hypothetical protein ABIA76_01120 [Candidatus Diapherotrites archaeon]